MATRINVKGSNTGYYGADGSIMPVYYGGKLAPSLLTGDGSQMGLWTAVVIHVAALALTITANSLFFAADRSKGADLAWGWAISSLVGHCLAVISVLVATGFIKDCLSMPIINTVIFGLFFGAFTATAKLSYMHGAALAADEPENIVYNLALLFQVLGFGSVLANAFTAASKSGGM